MATFTNRTVNENGLAQIAKFLSENTSKQFTLEADRAALNAWAADAEFQMGNGNPPCIEISSAASIHGYTQEFEISAEGIDAETLNDE
jgi:hypothetical protein